MSPTSSSSLGRELAAAGRFASGRGWLPATSGNLSGRLDARRILVTASGTDKGALTERDFLVVDGSDGPVEDARRASAEVALHHALYARARSIGAVLHTHSRAATVLSRVTSEALVLEGWELSKALAGVETHEARVVLPVIANDQDVPRLAARASAALDAHPGAPGYLIAGHGTYTWGSSVREALRHLEAIEFLLACELDRRILAR